MPRPGCCACTAFVWGCYVCSPEPSHLGCHLLRVSLAAPSQAGQGSAQRTYVSTTPCLEPDSPLLQAAFCITSPHIRPRRDGCKEVSGHVEWASGEGTCGALERRWEPTCVKWFCMTSRMMPNSSKYPPRPSVPKGSLKQICTFEIKFLCHVGDRNWLANLHPASTLSMCDGLDWPIPPPYRAGR